MVSFGNHSFDKADKFLPAAIEQSSSNTKQTVERSRRDTLSQKYEPFVTKMQLAGQAGSGTLSTINSNNRAELEQSSLGTADGVIALTAGLDLWKIADGKKVVREVGELLETMHEEYAALRSEIEQTSDVRKINELKAQKEFLSDRLTYLEKMARVELAKAGGLKNRVVNTATQGTITTFRRGSLIINMIKPEITTTVAFGVGGVATIIFSIHGLKKKAITKKRLRKECEAVTALFNEHAPDDASVMHDVYKYRLDNLQKQRQETTLSIHKNRLTLVSGSLGTITAGKMFATGASAIFAGTGFGAIAVAGLVVLVGSAYFVNKHKKTIGYYAKDTVHSMEEKLLLNYLKMLTFQKKLIMKKISQIEKNAEKYNLQTDDEYRKKLDAIWNEMEEIKSKSSLTEEESQHLDNLKKRQQELIIERISKYVGRNVEKKHDWTLIISFNLHETKVQRAAQKIEGVQSKRRQNHEEHVYHEYLKNFQTLSLEDLKELECKVIQSGPEELEKIKAYAIAQTGRVQSLTNPTLLHADMECEGRFGEVIRIITAQV